MMKKALLFWIFIITVSSTSVFPAANWVNAPNSGGNDDACLSWGMYYRPQAQNSGNPTNDDTDLRRNTSTAARIYFTGNTALFDEITVDLDFRVYAASEATTRIKHYVNGTTGEQIAFGFSGAATQRNNGQPNEGPVGSSSEYIRWSTIYAQDDPLDAYSYLRLFSGTVRYSSPTGTNITIFSYTDASSNNQLNYTQYILAGDLTMTNHANGRLGTDFMDNRENPAVRIEVFIPNALFWTGLKNKWGLNVLGLKCPNRLYVRFYRVPLSTWQTINNTTPVTSLGASPTARRALEVKNTRLNLTPTNQYLGGRIKHWDSTAEVADMININSQADNNSPHTVDDYRDHLYAYVIEVPFSGNTKYSALKKAADADDNNTPDGGFGTTEDAEMQVIFSPNQGAFK